MLTRASENLNIVFVSFLALALHWWIIREKKIVKTLIASLAFVKVTVTLLSYHLSLSQLTKQTFLGMKAGASTFHLYGWKQCYQLMIEDLSVDSSNASCHFLLEIYSCRYHEIVNERKRWDHLRSTIPIVHIHILVWLGPFTMFMVIKNMKAIFHRKTHSADKGNGFHVIHHIAAKTNIDTQFCWWSKKQSQRISFRSFKKLLGKLNGWFSRWNRIVEVKDSFKKFNYFLFFPSIAAQYLLIISHWRRSNKVNQNLHKHFFKNKKKNDFLLIWHLEVTKRLFSSSKDASFIA